MSASSVRRSSRRSAHAARRSRGFRISSAGPKVGSTGSGCDTPGMAASSHAPRGRRREAWPSIARTASGPSRTRRRGAARATKTEEERQADRQFRGAGRPVSGRTPGDQRAQQQTGARQADAAQHPVEIGARHAGERHAGAVIVGAGRIADQQQAGRWIALREHQVACGVAQGAAVEAGNGGAQVGERVRGGGGLRRAFGRSADGLPNPRRCTGEGVPWLPLPRSGGGLGRGRRPQPIDRLGLERFVRAPLDLQPQRGKVVHPSAGYSAASARA